MELLKQVRIIDLTRVLAGPYATMVLADLGADVIKIESTTTGDETRTWGPPFRQDGHSSYFAAVNRNKKSLAINLKTSEGRSILYKLVQEAQVVIHNYLPDTQNHLGITPTQLLAENPRLILVSLAGYGADSPLENTPGYDFTIQALSGLMAITGEPNGTPMKVGVALTDIITGLFAAVSVLAGLLGQQHKAIEGGQHLDVSLFGATMSALTNVAQAYLTTGQIPQRWGNAHAQIVPYQSFQTLDGYLVIAVGNDHQFQKFAIALERPDWLQNPAFSSNPERVKNRSTVVSAIQKELLASTTKSWQSVLEKAEIPHAPVQTLQEAETFVAQNLPRLLAHDQGGYRYFNHPIYAPGHSSRSEVATPAKLGEHTEELLHAMGYSMDQIKNWLRQGIVASPP